MKSVFRISLLFIVMSVPCLPLLRARQGNGPILYVGTANSLNGQGILCTTFDSQSGAIGSLKPTGGVTGAAAALLPHPNGKYLYATVPLVDAGGKSIGGVAAFTVDTATGALTEIDRRDSGGLGPLFLSIDSSGRMLLVANASSATVGCFSLRPDGRFGEASTVIKHEGESRNSKKRPQSHSIAVAPGDRIAVSADTGLDRVFVYRLDSGSASMMTPAEPASVPVAVGAGPRHITFHPNGKFAYTMNELDSTVTAYRFDRKRGALSALQAESALPADYKGSSYGADIHVHPNGELLFGSNRGHDSIAVFRIDPKTGRSSSLGQTQTLGKFPRSFALDPSGRFLVVANEKSDELRIFRIDAKNGTLEAVGGPIPTSRPIAVRFFPQS